MMPNGFDDFESKLLDNFRIKHALNKTMKESYTSTHFLTVGNRKSLTIDKITYFSRTCLWVLNRIKYIIYLKVNDSYYCSLRHCMQYSGVQLGAMLREHFLVLKGSKCNAKYIHKRQNNHITTHTHTHLTHSYCTS